MTLHLHHLTGCAPAPLAHYLKALGILRIVAEQKDPEARGWWRDEHFCMLTTLDREGLETFLLEEYSPTPVFNPWGGRSGFYPGSSEKTARVALQQIEASDLSRLEDFRGAVKRVRWAIDKLGGQKPKSSDDQAKADLISLLRKELRGAAADWMSAVIALIGDENRAPALLGTGGNEGSGSYTSAYFRAVVSCVIDRSSDNALGLFVRSGSEQAGARPNYSWEGSFGQFMPDGVGSAWDFLLLTEGASLFRSTITLRSRTSTSSRRFLASPFYFPPHAAGSGSSARLDEYVMQKGRATPGRGEQWFPLWNVPVTLAELRSLINEGRCSTGRNHARRPLEAAQAIGRLGIARGVTAFCRYGYLQRNNLSTHFAVPLGRIDVVARPGARLADDLRQWLDRLHRQARSKQSPARLEQAERRLADAVFGVLSHNDTPDRWQAVLLAAAAMEEIQASGTAITAGPIPRLGPGWLAAADDGSAEWRLACALGSAAGTYDRQGRARDSVRHHWLPLEPRTHRFRVSEKRLIRDPRVVAGGRDLVADLGAIVLRRLVEGAQRGDRRLALVSASGYEASPGDLAALIAGAVDVDRVLRLARALMAVRWRRCRGSLVVPPGPTTWPDEAWMALRLSSLPWSLGDDQLLAPDEAMVRRLTAGDGSSAVELALRRLAAAGLRPPLRAAFTDATTARLWAAALAFPISKRTARALARRFESPNPKEIR